MHLWSVAFYWWLQCSWCYVSRMQRKVLFLKFGFPAQCPPGIQKKSRTYEYSCMQFFLSKLKILLRWHYVSWNRRWAETAIQKLRWTTDLFTSPGLDRRVVLILREHRKTSNGPYATVKAPCLWISIYVIFAAVLASACVKHTCTVAIGKPEWQVRKASHCGSKQQQWSHATITLLLLVRATYLWVLFFAHIPFVVNHTFNATTTERLQQSILKVGKIYNIEM